MTERDSLIDFVTAVSGDDYLKVEENLGDGYVRLKISEAERRQAKHDIRSVEDVIIELLRNARDAHARRIFVANHREGDVRTITVIDDGVGVPVGMHDRVFEPRVTSKLETMVIDEWGVHGRGMALFSIRSNTVTANVVASDSHKGTSLQVTIDTSQLAERADQSTWPDVERTDEGLLRVARGPHNVVRRCVEFAVEHPGLEVYLGSPTEVLTTMHAIARRELDASALLFCDDLARLPVWQRAAAAGDAAELTDVAEELGVPVSERTAHRVLAEELAPLETVVRLAVGEESQSVDEVAPDIYRDRRGLRIHHTDLDEFRRDLEKAFDTIADRYYVHLRCQPKVTVARDEIRVRFEVDKED